MKSGKASDFPDFVRQSWEYSYDAWLPGPVNTPFSDAFVKKTLAGFFTRSFVSDYPLKFNSGEGLLVATCENLARAEIGFVGRVLLNAFNALEYGQQNNRSELVANSYAVFDSYLDHGFTANGLFREHVNYDKDVETSIFSIRRQSEGVYAMFQFLQYEKNNGRRHPEWETKLQTLLDRMLLLQNEDGSFPRKFTDNLVISDASGGSTPSVTLPLVMAYRYFNNPKYLTASWYYLWDVPFAQGQMIGDNGLQTRGWGNFTILWRWCNILTGTMARTEKGFITIFLLRDGP